MFIKPIIRSERLSVRSETQSVRSEKERVRSEDSRTRSENSVTHALMWVPNEPPKPPPAPVARFDWCPQQLAEDSVEEAVDVSHATVTSFAFGEVRRTKAQSPTHVSKRLACSCLQEHSRSEAGARCSGWQSDTSSSEDEESCSTSDGVLASPCSQTISSSVSSNYSHSFSVAHPRPCER